MPTHKLMDITPPKSCGTDTGVAKCGHGSDVVHAHIWCMVCRHGLLVDTARVHPLTPGGFLPATGWASILPSMAAPHLECLNPVLHLLFSVGSHDIIAGGGVSRQHFNSPRHSPNLPILPVCQLSRPYSLSLVPAAFCMHCKLIALFPLTCRCQWGGGEWPVAGEGRGTYLTLGRTLACSLT